MYSFFDGIIADITDNALVIETNGIGYEIFTTARILSSVTVGEKKKIYVYLNVKEDEMSLYGFSNKAEKAMFLHLISISGIGPKLAISILSGVDLKDLAMYIVSGNSSQLNKIKGVGKKTAERIIIELKDKLAGEYKADEELTAAIKPSSDLEDAVLYLMAMGIAKAEALRRIKIIATEGMTVEQLVVAALASK